MDINIKVKDKIAVGDETLIVCGNSDYTVNFELDAEWAAYDKKTMRIGYRNGKYKDVDFTGASCALPVIKKRPWIAVGLYAGRLKPRLRRCSAAPSASPTEMTSRSTSPRCRHIRY